MSDDVCSFFQNVLLVGSLPWVIVVNDIGHSVFISPVGHDADMSFKDHDIAALPLFRFRDICCQGSLTVVREKNAFRFRTRAESLYVCIRRC